MKNEDRLRKEQEYLDEVKKVIFKEKSDILESLKRVPEEYKGRYSDVKWGDDDLVKHLSNMYSQRFKTISNLEKKPYFGSFDFGPSSMKIKKFRLGKTDVFDGKNMLVLDWRNPICTLYYDQSIGNVSYSAPDGKISGLLTNKSQILIEDGIVQSVTDVDLVSDDELLQPYLDVNADNRMKTIIASIQAEQNSIIRRPITKNLIVQGVAGSGKTSVALHRIAYLLYNSANKYNENHFIVIGPNKYFLNYISSILPDLDTPAVKECTFEEIVMSIIGEKAFDCETSNNELDRHLAVNGYDDEVKKFKGSLAYKLALDKFISDYFTTTLCSIKYNNLVVFDEEYLKNRIKPTFGYSDAVKKEISNMIKKMKENWEDVYYNLSRPLASEMKQYPLRSPERTAIIAQMDAIKESAKKGFSNEIKKSLRPLFISPINLYKIFLENIDKYIDSSTINLEKFKTNTLCALKKKTIPYEDLAAVSYLSLLYNGKSNYDGYRQVVIDEAQDYSLFQFYIFRELFKNSNFSIFGDLAQSIYSYRTIDSWENVKKHIFGEQCEILNLNKSYRTTCEITDTSNLILEELRLPNANPVIRNGEKVGFIDVSTEEKSDFYVSKIAEFRDKKYKSVGIICKTEDEIKNVSKDLEKNGILFHTVKNSDCEYAAGICLLTPYLAKGLEFDSVIINDASEKIYNSNSTTDLHLLYVASTRALHEMTVLYDENLCKVFSHHLENSKSNNKVKVKI